MTDAGGTPWATPESDALPESGPVDDQDFTDVATAAEMAGFSAGPPTLEFALSGSDETGDDVPEDAVWDLDDEAPVIIETMRVPEAADLPKAADLPEGSPELAPEVADSESGAADNEAPAASEPGTDEEAQADAAAEPGESEPGTDEEARTEADGAATGESDPATDEEAEAEAEAEAVDADGDATTTETGRSDPGDAPEASPEAAQADAATEPVETEPADSEPGTAEGTRVPADADTEPVETEPTTDEESPTEAEADADADAATTETGRTDPSGAAHGASPEGQADAAAAEPRTDEEAAADAHTEPAETEPAHADAAVEPVEAEPVSSGPGDALEAPEEASEASPAEGFEAPTSSDESEAVDRSDASEEPVAALPDTEQPEAAETAGPASEVADSESTTDDATSRAAALAASWIPRSAPVRAAGTASVFGSRAGSPTTEGSAATDAEPVVVEAVAGSERESESTLARTDAADDAETESSADAGVGESPPAPATVPAEHPADPGERAPGSAGWGAAETDALTEAVEVEEEVEASPSESAAREGVEDVPAEDIQVEVQDRWWIEPEDALSQPDAAFDDSDATLAGVAPEGISSGPTPDPAFLASLLDRTEDSQPPGAESEPEPPEATHLEASEPEPVDAIAASFGSWVEPQTRRELQPLSTAGASSGEDPEVRPDATGQEESSAWTAWPRPPQSEDADSEDRAAWPQAGLSTLGTAAETSTDAVSAEETLAPDADPAEAPSTDSPEGTLMGRFATPPGGVRRLSVLGDPAAPADPADPADPATALPLDATPEARLRAQLRQRAASATGTPNGPSASGDLWLLTGEPERAATDATIRSPVLSLVLTAIAVLIVVVIVVGVLYMFDIL